MRFRRSAFAAAMVFGLFAACTAARALDAVNVRTDAPAIDLTDATELQKSDGELIQVSTAPAADGIVRRIGVRAREGGNNWAVIAVANSQRRTARPPDRHSALSHGWLGLAVARPRHLARRQHHAKFRRPAPTGRTPPPRTFIASRSIPAPSSPTCWNCAPTSCRRSICGSPTPTRTRSTRSRSTMAS